MSTITRRPGYVVAVLLALVACLPWEAPASAQGTAGSVPDPIGLRDLTSRTALYTTLRPEDRVAIQRAHDAYLESFARLRDDEIDSFLSLMDELSGGMSGRMPDLASVDRMLESWEDVRDRVGVLDARLFETIGGSLDDRGRDAVDRLRKVRDRERFLASTGMMAGRFTAGIDRVFWSMDPSAEEIAAVDEVLRAYESAMPRLAEELADASVGSIRRITAGMIEAGLGDLTAERMMDPEDVERIMAVVDTVMAAAAGPTLEAQEALEDRELVAWRGLRSRLSPARGHRLKRLWAAEAFPSSGLAWQNDGSIAVPRMADLVRDAIGEDVEASIVLDRLLEEWYRSDDQITDRLLEASRLLMRGSLGASFDAGEGQRLQAEAVEDRTRLARATRDRMLELVPTADERADLRQRIDDLPGSFVQAGRIVPIESRRGSDEDADVEAVPRTPYLEPLADPITTADLEVLAVIAGVDETSRPILEALHDDYLEAWSSRVVPLAKQATAVPVWNDPEGMPTRWALIEEAVRTALALDEDLVASLEAALGDEDTDSRFDAVRVQRGFDRNAAIADRQSRSGFGMTPAVAGSPYRGLIALELPPEEFERAMATLLDRTSSLRDAVEGIELKRLRSSRAVEDAGVAYNLAVRRSMETGDAPQAEQGAAQMAASQVYYAAIVEAAKQRLDIDRGLRGPVEEVVEGVADELPEIAALEYRIAMRERRSGRGERALSSSDLARQVLRLPDLGPDQVEVVRTLVLDHLEREVAEVDALVERLSDGPGPSGDGTMSMAREQERVEFRRAELEERLIQRLLAILTPEQAGRIPRLAERLRD